MYASLHLPSPQAAPQQLMDLAMQFSPAVEQTWHHTVVFSISALRKLIGPPNQIAAEICRNGFDRKLQAHLAIASNPDTAVLLACNFPGVTLTTRGEEKLKIAPLPLSALFVHAAAEHPGSAELLQILHKWGVKTCGELAQLPEAGLAERLGKAGVYLHQLSLGIVDRPLRLAPPPTVYQERLALEYPLDLLEPLLFLLGRILGELCKRLQRQSRAARSLKATLELENRKEHCCNLEFPVPLDETKTLLKLLQLHLERHGLEAPVVAFTLELEPVEPKRLQEGFFLPPAPAADKLQITLSRIAGMVGEENVGSPQLLNTYRPDAFKMASLDPSIENDITDNPISFFTKSKDIIRLSMRIFRPALQARVRVAGITPKTITATGVKGTVLRSAGPWKTSGEWWANTAWMHEEWDVALDDGALYRIYQDNTTNMWFVQGVYD